MIEDGKFFLNEDVKYEPQLASLSSLNLKHLVLVCHP